MNKPHALVVDDEENIRLTLSESLSTLPALVDSAANGQEALDKVEQQVYSIILLDLRMPDMDGMQVLERLRESRPEIPVVIITAHGTIESAVDAMKLGAIEFLQKPFVPEQVRTLVRHVLQRGQLRESQTGDYATYFELAKRCLSERHMDAALEQVRKAISISPERPEAYNLLGAIHEIRHEIPEALNNYRTALTYDASYEPSRRNLERATSRNVWDIHPQSRPILLGELRENLKDKA